MTVAPTIGKYKEAMALVPTKGIKNFRPQYIQLMQIYLMNHNCLVHKYEPNIPNPSPVEEETFTKSVFF